jgi:hypothetical protein
LSGPGQCNNAGATRFDPAGANESRNGGPEHLTVSSVERVSTNVDFLPDLAPLRNGAIFSSPQAIVDAKRLPRCVGCAWTETTNTHEGEAVPLKSKVAASTAGEGDWSIAVSSQLRFSSPPACAAICREPMIFQESDCRLIVFALQLLHSDRAALSDIPFRSALALAPGTFVRQWRCSGAADYPSAVSHTQRKVRSWQSRS